MKPIRLLLFLCFVFLGIARFAIAASFRPSIHSQTRIDTSKQSIRDYVQAFGRYGDHVYQWVVDLDSVPSNNTSHQRKAFLWIPPHCKQVKGIIVSGHNMIEEGILEDSLFRTEMSKLDFAELWVTPDFADGGVFDVSKGAEKGFLEAVNKLADISGYDEVRFAPVVYLSHSAQASNPWNFGAWNPERTLAMISYHGDSPRSSYLCCNHFNPDWGDRNIDGIPGLICVGSKEFNEFRIEDSFRFMRQYPNSLISFLCNAGRGHIDFSEEDLRYLIRFIQKAAQYRMPEVWDGKNLMNLKKLSRSDGWAADRWHKDAKPASVTNLYNSYHGPKDSCYWYFDEEMARWTESIYTRERGKKLQYLTMMQNGKILKPGEPLNFVTDGKNMIVCAKTVFTDSCYTRLSGKHTIEPVWVKRICGPAQILNDSTFSLKFYRPGPSLGDMGGILMFAFAESDMSYGHVGCPISWNIRWLTEGEKQYIKFPKVNNVKLGTPYIKLLATSDSGLPVQYYIQNGPAVVDGNNLIFTDVPEKAKLPIEVTVVAYQYGSMVNPKIQTASPVKQSFYILR